MGARAVDLLRGDTGHGVSADQMYPVTWGNVVHAQRARVAEPDLHSLAMPGFAGWPTAGGGCAEWGVVRSPRFAVEVTLVARIRWIGIPARCSHRSIPVSFHLLTHM